MTYLRNLLHDILLVASIARREWRYIRTHLRRGGNPDEAF